MKSLPQALEDLFSSGIIQVSPGALAMNVHHPYSHPAFQEHEIGDWIKQTRGITYRSGIGPRWDHGWIVKTDE